VDAVDAVAVSAGLVADLVAAGLSQRKALALAGMSRSTWHYRHHPRPRVASPVPHTVRRSPAWLSLVEQRLIVTKLQTAVAQGWAVYHAFYEALDTDDPVASLSSWYRIARTHLDTQRPLRRTRQHRSTAIPSLIVDAPLQAWSWDITHLKGPYRRVTYQLYVTIDVFSRMIVAWRLETREDDDLARDMFEDAFTRHGARPRVVHSDGGPAMTSRTLTGLFRDLGIEVSRNRPRVSNDNPFSESLFKTAKYTPTYPTHFDGIEHARAWAEGFVAWYNHDHHHSGLEGHTPADVHDGTWAEVHQHRVTTMTRLHAAHPERFRHPPVIKTPMAQVAINQPTTHDRLQTA
jgi:transposase InsO family protein